MNFRKMCMKILAVLLMMALVLSGCGKLSDTKEDTNTASDDRYAMVLELLATNNISEVGEKMAEWYLAGLVFPFTFRIDGDGKAYVEIPQLILNDINIYNSDHTSEFINAFSFGIEHTIMDFGYTDHEAMNYIAQMVTFDGFRMSRLIEHEIDAYELMSIEAFAENSYSIDLKRIAEEITGETISEIYVQCPGYFEDLDAIIDGNLFEYFKSWIMINTFLDIAEKG